jgi:hypothetical protein
MRFLTWLQKHTSNRVPPSRTPQRRALASFRPRLEALEGRDVPSTLKVGNLFDNGSADSLRAEIAAAQSGDTIIFDPTLSGTITLAEGELPIAKNLTILGPGSGQLSISGGAVSSGGYGSRVIEIDGAATAVTLSGLSFTGGTGLHYPYYFGGRSGIGWGSGGGSGGTGIALDGQGGAVWNGGALTMSGCSLTYNSVDDNPTYSISSFYGGAVYNAGSLTISKCDLSHNAAGDWYAGNGGNGGNGGAIYNTGTLFINTNSNLSLNTAYGSAYAIGFGTGIGGAIDNTGSLTVNSGVLSGNSAYDGGAIFSGYKTSAAITGATLSGNTATYGGAFCNNGTMTLSGCEAEGNTAQEGGGIFSAKDGHLTIQSKSTVTGNSGFGADLYNLGAKKISKDSTVGVIVG